MVLGTSRKDINLWQMGPGTGENWTINIPSGVHTSDSPPMLIDKMGLSLGPTRLYTGQHQDIRHAFVNLKEYSVYWACPVLFYPKTLFRTGTYFRKNWNQSSLEVPVKKYRKSLINNKTTFFFFPNK